MIAEIISNLFTLQTLLALAVGVCGGIVIGALPGLGATMGIAILIPVTYSMEPVAALVMLTAIYTSAIYGGSVTAILLHTPGTPASAATAMDGYKLTLRGEGLRAIGMSTVGSMIGGTISGVLLLVIAPPLARFSLKFNAPEYFLLAVFGLTIIGTLAANNLLKPSDGRPVAVPTQDMVLGSYYLTMEKDGEKGEGKVFRDVNEALMAYQEGDVSIHAKIKVRITKDIGEKRVSKIIDCTVGRLIFNENIPQLSLIHI